MSQARGNRGPVAVEPKVHLEAVLIQKRLDPAEAGVPECQTHPNGTEKMSQTDVPLGYTPIKLWE
jgi:hypothetical protein